MKKEIYQVDKLLKLFLTVLLLATVTPSFSQTDGAREAQEKHFALQRELKGVFQIQMVGVRTKPAISTDLYEMVMNKQQQSTQSVFMYNDIIRIVVLSKDAVLNGELFGDEDIIVYTNL
jgi:hypothetical protein